MLVRQLFQRLGVRLLCAQQRFVILLQGGPHPGPVRIHGVARNDLIARDLGRHIKVDLGFAHQKILLGKSMLSLAHLQLFAVNGVAQRIQAPVAPVQKQLGIPVFVAVLHTESVAFAAAFPPQIGREHLPDLFRLGVARIQNPVAVIAQAQQRHVVFLAVCVAQGKAEALFVKPGAADAAHMNAARALHHRCPGAGAVVIQGQAQLAALVFFHLLGLAGHLQAQNGQRRTHQLQGLVFGFGIGQQLHGAAAGQGLARKILQNF